MYICSEAWGLQFRLKVRRVCVCMCVWLGGRGGGGRADFNAA